ncbi:classical arabinogalactan protein 7 isoform X2 [Pararge aegeria]|nr:classical arabinogalactan protein 7 isoform X2 [Pararge aegeria]
MSSEPALYITGIGVMSILMVVCCYFCCCRRNRGQVLSPPPTNVQVQVPYPQQQYNAPYQTQVVTTYPVHTGAQVAYPHSTGQPYLAMPTASPNPAPAPYSSAPYPTAAYPTAAYPGAPYPGAGYPGGAYPPSAPSAPEANAMPPSYDQAVCAKPPPNNPYASQ